MTGTNHVLTGAAIALVVNQPVTAVVLAGLSHYVLDAVPHFGYDRDVKKRNASPLFWLVLRLDVLGTILTLMLLAFFLPDSINWLALLCMLTALAPDFAWVYRFIVEQRRGIFKKPNWFNNFHIWIQRYERPWGIFIEIVWGIVIASILATV